MDARTDLELCPLADEREGGVDDPALPHFHHLRRHLGRAEALDVVDPLGPRSRASHLRPRLGLSSPTHSLSIDREWRQGNSEREKGR